jgi:hypothetical protein
MRSTSVVTVPERGRRSRKWPLAEVSVCVFAPAASVATTIAPATGVVLSGSTTRPVSVCAGSAAVLQRRLTSAVSRARRTSGLRCSAGYTAKQ